MPFSALLLAGGESKRMGQPKALLDWCGVPLWQHQLATLTHLRPAQILISWRGERPAAEPSLAAVEFISDGVVGAGPLAGLQAGLAVCRTPFLLLLAIDRVAVSVEFLTDLLTGMSSSGRGVALLLDGFYLGDVAIYPAGIRPAVDQAVASSDRSFQALIRGAVARNLMVARPVSEAERPLLRNLNTSMD